MVLSDFSNLSPVHLFCLIKSQIVVFTFAWIIKVLINSSSKIGIYSY